MEDFVKQVEDLIGTRLNELQINQFSVFENELLEWNQKFNLTAIRDAQGIRVRHFLDSLSCVLVARELGGYRLIDIGTGAGFPGIPLKILFPNIKLVLVESIGKKATFLENAVNKLDLSDVSILQTRAEELGQSKQHREKYDVALARAVAHLPTLVEYLLPLLKIGGFMIAQKGASGPAELHQAQNAVKLLGGEVRVIKHLNLPTVVEDRYLIVIDKIARTPDGYPRRTGMPAKNPIT